jgi:hypothetical protein
MQEKLSSRIDSNKLKELEIECRKVGIIDKIDRIRTNSYKNRLLKLSQENQDRLKEILTNICDNNIKLLRYCLLNNILDVHPICPICKEKDRKFDYHSGSFYKTCCSKECEYKQIELDYFNKTGYHYPGQNPEARRKGEQTYFKKTGYNYYIKNPVNKEKFKQTCLERYGVENPGKSEECQEKSKQTYFKKTGYYSPFQNPVSREKAKQTYFKKTGYDHNMKNPESKEKAKQTCKNNHGVEYFVLSDKFVQYGYSCYYDNIHFDSSYELVFYKWCIDHNITITREPTRIEYYNNNIKHYYYPDFEISYLDKTRLVEISSNYTWSTKSDEKKQLIKDNNILVLLDKDIQKYFDYCNRIKFDVNKYKIIKNNREVTSND